LRFPLRFEAVQRAPNCLRRNGTIVVGKFQITKGRDGSDQIQAGLRNLNVSDFLTK